MIPSQYTKFIVPLITAGLTTYIAVTGTGSNLFVLLSILIAIAQAVGTFRVGNADTGFLKYAKFWVGVLATVLQAVLLLVGNFGNLGAVTPVQWAGVALALIGAIGTGVLPNTPLSAIVGQVEPVEIPTVGPGLSIPLGGAPLDGQ